MTLFFCLLGVFFASWTLEIHATSVQIQHRLQEREHLLSCVALRTRQLQQALHHVQDQNQTLLQLREQILSAVPGSSQALEDWGVKMAGTWERARNTSPQSCPELEADGWEAWAPLTRDEVGILPAGLTPILRTICARGRWERHCGRVEDADHSRWLKGLQ